MSRYAKGCRPSPPGRVGMGSPPHHLMAAGVLPAAVSHRDKVVEVLNQGGTSACVAHAVAQQIRTALVAQGMVAPPLPSRFFIYYAARCESGEQHEDGGTIIANAYDAMGALGFPKESAWPFADDLIKVNTQPPYEAIREAADQRWLSGNYRITSTGAQRVHDVKAAIAAGHCVVLGTSVDQAFEDLGPGQIWNGCGPNPLGGHAILCSGYRPGAFEICNSWSAGWCDGGFCLISEAAMASAETSDIWVATVAPSYSDT